MIRRALLATITAFFAGRKIAPEIRALSDEALASECAALGAGFCDHGIIENNQWLGGSAALGVRVIGGDLYVWDNKLTHARTDETDGPTPDPNARFSHR